ncbi:3'-5' exonuclease [uncultured Marivirga sp.]|uniref:3'-5' exonuclease n=1 Tax=uncultured Marivirga sp. TaxID=1123707 RepID=UPI0030ED3D49|tara:strand:+ start:100898 stop:101599 length:702 start_codon:yes stop_codon:yes gene_type:complete
MAILFIDIETVPQTEYYNDLTEKEKMLWQHKASFLAKNEETAEDIYTRAGIYAEFGKIVVASLGWMFGDEKNRKLRLTTIANKNEAKLLEELVEILQKVDGTNAVICGHNIKEFDIPYICRRILVNGLKLPSILDVSAMKPWQTPYTDTLEMWKFGDRKHYTKLDLLAHIFDLPTSKDDIDGSQVYEVYYKEGDLKRIAEYCEKDVVLTCQLYLKLKGQPILQEEQIIKVKDE